jgi:hypothetical protein
MGSRTGIQKQEAADKGKYSYELFHFFYPLSLALSRRERE